MITSWLSFELRHTEMNVSSPFDREALGIRWSSRSSKPAVVLMGNGVFDSHALPPMLRNEW